MRNRTTQSAGVIIAIAFYVLLHVIYLFLGTVDIVYVKGDEVLCRQDDVCSLSPIDDPIANMDDETYLENKDITLWYLDTGEEFVYGGAMLDLRVRIAVNAITNLLTFRWSETSKPLVIVAGE